MKLDIKWKLQQLFEKYNIQKSYLLGHQETKREIIKYAKQMLNKTINDDNFADIAKDLNDYFFEEKLKISFLDKEYFPDSQDLIGKVVRPLGPISVKEAYSYNGRYTNLDDITEAHVNMETLSGEFKSKECGWIGWALVKDTSYLDFRSETVVVWIVTKNHFKQGTAISDVIAKKIKFKNSIDYRSLKKFAWNTPSWWHDDLEELHKQLPIG